MAAMSAKLPVGVAELCGYFGCEQTFRTAAVISGAELRAAAQITYERYPRWGDPLRKVIGYSLYDGALVKDRL